MFKGELGTIHDIEAMSLREISMRRDVRIKRKMAEAKEEEKRQKERERKADAAQRRNASAARRRR